TKMIARLHARMFARLKAGCRFGRSCSRESICLIFAVGILIAAVPTLSPENSLQAQSVSDTQVKAAFLYNFAKFVEWPADAFPDSGSPIVIGVVGNDPFGGTLDQTTSGKTANGRPI